MSTATDTDNEVEIAHIATQLLVVIAAMALVYFVVRLSFDKLANATVKASDVVAVVGAVTTFLGTAIGLFFGVTVGQAGKKSATDAAKVAQSTASTAANVAQQAQSVTGQALALTGQAQTVAQAATRQFETLKAASDRLVAKAAQLGALAGTENRARASAIVESARLGARPSDDKIRDIVSGIVRTALLDSDRVPADRGVDTGVKFAPPPPDGYGLSAVGFEKLCDDCTRQINLECESAIELSVGWRLTHQDRTVGDFVTDATQLAIDNPAI